MPHNVGADNGCGAVVQCVLIGLWNLFTGINFGLISSLDCILYGTRWPSWQDRSKFDVVISTATLFCNLLFPQFRLRPTKKKKIYDFSIFIYLCFSLQSSYAGAYLEDKLSFYNKHMEKYGQFTGKSRKKKNLKYLSKIYLHRLWWQCQWLQFGLSKSDCSEHQ